MNETAERIRDQGLITVVQAPVEDRVFDWGKAVAHGGIKLLGIPVTLRNVTEITSDLADEAHLEVGVTNVLRPEQVSVAVAAGADFVLTPIVDPEVIDAAKQRGLTCIVGAHTPTEVARAIDWGADLVTIHPIGVMGGPAYFEALSRMFRETPLLVSGGIDVESAPTFLEMGALAAIVDKGVFPMDGHEPAALEVITARAVALCEVCADAMGTPKRASFSKVLRLPPESGAFDDMTQPDITKELAVSDLLIEEEP